MSKVFFLVCICGGDLAALVCELLQPPRWCWDTESHYIPFRFFFRRLHIGLCSVTMLISMWISNTAATAMMCPILEATLVELESQKIVPRFVEKEGEPKPDDEDWDLSNATPTRNTICNYLSIAYSATIGGVGTLVGTGTNLTFKGIYETTFPQSDDGVSFLQWMVVGTFSFYFWFCFFFIICFFFFFFVCFFLFIEKECR